MPRRLTACLSLLVLATAPAGARAADAKPMTPPLVVRFQSIDDLRADILYVGKLVGQEEHVKQFDELVKSQLGDKSIDTKKPFGLYSVVADISDFAVVGLLPVSDEKAFLDLAGQLGSKPEKDEDGIYTTTPNAAPTTTVSFRFAHHYAYVAYGNKARLAKDQLIAPATLLGSRRSATASIVVHLDAISADMKGIGLQQFAAGIEQAKQAQQPNDTEVTRKVRGQVIDEFGKRVKRVVEDATTLELRFNVNRKEERFSFEGSFAGKPGSELASDIRALGETRSLFAGLARPEAAVSEVAHLELPANLRKAVASVVDEVISKGLQNEKDENKRREAEKLFKSLAPTIRAGELDAGVALRGPSTDKRYTLLLGLKVKDGRGLDKAIRDLVRRLPERDRAKVKWDAETVGRGKVHRAEVQEQFDEKARQLFGDNPLYFAVRNDRVVAVLGPDGLAAIKDLVSAEPAPGPVFEEGAALSRLVPLLAAVQPKVAEVAQTAFGAGGHDRVRFTLSGGKALTARFTMDAAVVKFVSQLLTPYQAAP
jgi:hypothetical protein